MIIQSITFNRKTTTPEQARLFIKTMGLKPIKKVHKTKNRLRYRITPPVFKKYITKKLPHDIHLIIGVK